MAAFPPITIADNPDGWGPTALPESLLNFPYHVYSKGERLGKVADWTGQLNQQSDRRGGPGRGGPQQFHAADRPGPSDARVVATAERGILLDFSDGPPSAPLSRDTIEAIASATTGQKENPIWFNAHIGRLTPSLMDRALKAHRAPNANELVRLVRKDVYTMAAWMREEVPAVEWGNVHEADAIAAYVKRAELKGERIRVRPTGLWLFPNGVMGASPDGIVEALTPEGRWRTLGVLEVKCAFRMRDLTFEQMRSLGRLPEFLTLNRATGEYGVNGNHKHYHQLQAELFATGLPWCDLAVWTPVDLLVVRVTPEPSWTAEVLPKLVEFYFANLVPDKWDKLTIRTAEAERDEDALSSLVGGASAMDANFQLVDTSRVQRPIYQKMKMKQQQAKQNRARQAQMAAAAAQAAQNPSTYGMTKSQKFHEMYASDMLTPLQAFNTVMRKRVCIGLSPMCFASMGCRERQRKYRQWVKNSSRFTQQMQPGQQRMQQGMWILDTCFLFRRLYLRRSRQ